MCLCSHVASARQRRRAFSLMEMLVVMTLILVIAGLVFSNMGVLRSSGVTLGGNMVLNEMNLAREISIAKNQPVELWFLRKTGATGAGTLIDGLQICTIGPTGTPSPGSVIRYIPKETGIDSGPLSPLISAGTAKVWGGSVSKLSLAGYGTAYDCWYVRFLPDGSTTLNISKQWYVTLHDRSLGDTLPKLPDNYAIISVSPTSGRITMERP